MYVCIYIYIYIYTCYMLYVIRYMLYVMGYNTLSVTVYYIVHCNNCIIIYHNVLCYKLHYPTVSYIMVSYIVCYITRSCASTPGSSFSRYTYHRITSLSLSLSLSIYIYIYIYVYIYMYTYITCTIDMCICICIYIYIYIC